MSARWNFSRRPFRDDRPAYVSAAVLFLAGAALLVGNIRLFTEYRRGVADVRAAIATLETRQRAADAATGQAKAALSSYRLSALAEESRELSRIAAERRFSWTTLLGRLERTLPWEAGIQNLQPQFGKNGEIHLQLQLVGKSREAVVPTIAALTRDPAFTDVRLLTESQPEGSTADPFQFVVESVYEPNPSVAGAAAAGKAADRAAGKASDKAADKAAERSVPKAAEKKGALKPAPKPAPKKPVIDRKPPNAPAAPPRDHSAFPGAPEAGR